MAEPKVTVDEKGTKMTIVIDLTAKGEPSASGKTNVIGSTHGNKAFDVGKRTLYVGLNVYEKK